MLENETKKLVSKCYPSGKDAEKRPVSNELSMLIFHLQTHRSKIPKAAKLLMERAQHYMHKDNPGNFVVTALIMLEITKEMQSDFGLFEEESLAIVQMLIERSKTGDLQLFDVSRQLFAAYNASNQGLRFLGHPAYCQHFIDVLKEYAQIAAGAKYAQMRVTALRALGSFATSRALSTSVGQKGVSVAMRGVEPNIPHDPKIYPQHNPHESKESKEAEDDSVGSEAIVTLSRFLDTPTYDQIGRVIGSLLKWLSGSSGTWQPQLLVSVAQWVPPLSRFLVTKDLMATMSSLPASNVKQQLIYSGYLDALLSSDVAKIDLSVVDLLQHLMFLQRRLIEHPPQGVDPQSIQHLVARLRNNIGNLASMQVYPGQCSDMISEILLKYAVVQPTSIPANGLATTMTPPSSAESSSLYQKKTRPSAGDEPGSPLGDANEVPNSVDSKLSDRSFGRAQERSIGVIVNDLRDLQEILVRASATKDVQRLNLSLWEDTQWLLSSKHPQPLLLYTVSFSKYMLLAPESLHPNTKRGSYVFRQLCRMLLLEDLAPANYIAIYYCIIAQIQYFGAKSLYLLPWLMRVVAHAGLNQGAAGGLEEQLVDLAPSDHAQRVCKSSVVLAALLAIFRGQERAEPSAVVFDFVQTKVDLNLWLPGITYPLVSSPEVSISNIVNSSGFEFGSAAVQGSLPDLPGLQDMRLNNAELDIIQNPGFQIDSPLDAEDLRAMKGRSSSVSSASQYRSTSTHSQRPSVTESRVPRVGQLRRQQTDILSLRSTSGRTVSAQSKPNTKGVVVNGAVNGSNMPAMPAKPAPSNEQLVALLRNLNIDNGPQGSLTV